MMINDGNNIGLAEICWSLSDITEINEGELFSGCVGDSFRGGQTEALKHKLGLGVESIGFKL